MDELTPTTQQAMARFRASLLRRASAVAWVVLIIIAAQAVRNEVFVDVGFWIPMTALAALLVVSAATRWDKLMATRYAPWIASSWLAGLTIGLTAFALVPELTATATPILYGIAAVSGLLLVWWAHAFMTVFIAAAASFIALSTGTADTGQDVVALALTVMVVSAATALIGMEFEREAVRSADRENQIDQQRLDFERLYAVSATLARAESLSEIVPHLVGTICKYLDAQVGVVLLYNPERHRLEVMSPIWVNGHPLDTDPIVLDVTVPGVVSQTYRSGKPFFVREVDQETDAHVLLKELGLKQALVAPLKVENLRVGAIIVGDPYVGSFNEDQLEQLGSLAAPAGLVLSQIGRYEAQAEMTKRLEEVAKMKTDFVSTVSHELRTPLTSIIGSLDTVNRPELAPTQATAQQLLGTARRQAGRLQRLIDDLLVVSRIDRGAIPVHLEPVPLKLAFEEVNRVVSIEPTFTIEPDDLTVEADRDHLTRILINLVENAAKYAVNSPVELYAWERPNKAVIAVVDHGPGIPDHEKERVFERFTQIDQSDTRSKGGTGLGLSIVRSLAEVMHGAVRVESTEGGGATFVVELPLARALQARHVG
ncbi:MAG TPA: GAF domain-containing sensor histidine kinase [Acidimicrobiia bacterium]|jgi:signal transduction histidine kinase